MKIIKATSEHTKLLYEIEAIVFANDAFALSKASIKYHLESNIFFIAYENDIALGYILWLERKSYFRLYSLAILPEHQGKGVASKLLEYSFDNLTCKKFSLEVKQSNTKAISLYKRHGFEIVKNLPQYYKDADGFFMQKITQNCKYIPKA